MSQKVFRYHLSGLCAHEVYNLVRNYAVFQYYDDLLTGLWILTPFCLMLFK